MKYFLVLFILTAFFFTSDISHSQTEDELINSGLADIYNLNFPSAISKFKQLQKEYPNKINGYFYESIVYFYEALGTRNEIIFEKYMDASDRLIEKCDKLLDKNENDIDALYYKGQSHSYRSLLLLTLNKSLLKAASNGSDGYTILTDIIKRKPDYYDAYMGLGLYKIAIGFVPEKFKWLLNFIGFDGNLKEGYELLLKSSQNGKFTKTDSKIALAFFSVQEKEAKDERTVKMMKEILDQFPNSPIIKILYAGSLQLTGKTDETIPIIEDALRLNTGSMQNEINKGGYALLGNAYFKRNDFENAIKYLEEHLKHVVDEDRYNITMYNLGMAYELSGNRSKALEKFKLVRKKFIDERDGEGEKMFYKFAQDRIANPLSNLDVLLIKGMNLRESGKFKESADFYKNLISSKEMDVFNSNEDKIRIFMESGSSFLMNEEIDLAFDYFMRVTKLKSEREKFNIPTAYFELGKIYWKRGDKVNAEKMFEKIFEFGDYENRQSLEMRLKSFKEGV
ncbi:MAG TPA: DUF3808 domain-containing protein [Ignavibacteria bacterium]|nr:DUF3808 domain-containing protein [Ignavibacteria bacterium]